MLINIRVFTLCSTLALLGACSTVKTAGKIAGLPVKGVLYTGKGLGKGVLKTGELTGKGVYYTGKGVYHTGKGVYKVAKVPVNITNAALDTSAKMLTVTTQVVDVTGKVVNVSRDLQRGEVDGYVRQAKGAANVLGILIDVARNA